MKANYRGNSGSVSSWECGPYLITHEIVDDEASDLFGTDGYHNWLVFDPTETCYAAFYSHSNALARRRALRHLRTEIALEDGGPNE